MTHSKPYRPQGRGKIERFFNTVNSQFLTEITTVDTATGVVDAGVGSMVTSLDELNALFTSWVEMVYHQAGASPHRVALFWRSGSALLGKW